MKTVLITENENIFVTQGDSAEIAITPLNDDESGTPYFLQNGEYVRFFVRLLPGSEPVIEKTLDEQNEDGTIDVRLSPEDTDISRASYLYEAKLYNADDSEICTFIGGGTEKPRFVVT